MNDLLKHRANGWARRGARPAIFVRPHPGPARSRAKCRRGVFSRVVWTLLGLLLGGGSIRVFAAGPYGVDAGWTVDHNSGQIDFTTAIASQMSQGEAGWVRVEMSLVKGHTNWDATMLGYYDTVVNNAHLAGMQVLMLIDAGSWPGDQAAWCANNAENNPGANGDNSFVDNYATNAVAPIVRHFHDRVKVYELWNEPNCWTANPANGVYTGATYVYPSNFGWLLARSWEAVHGTYHLSDATLFSGGLFGLNAYGSSYSAAGGQYLDDTYSTGTNVNKGASFAHTKSLYNAYPLDGVGEHIYINQGGLAASNTFRQYEDWVHQALTKYEGSSSPKRTFITEFGWQTTNSSNAGGVSAAIQDTNLAVAFAAIDATPYVQMAIWFNWQDNPAGALWYGVLDSSGNPKPSYHDFQTAERFEGIYCNGTTNLALQSYFSRLGQSILGSPGDAGRGPWVTNFLTAYVQDYCGGSHSNLMLLATTNGTYEINNLYGFWNYYQANNGATNCGLPIDNSSAGGDGVRQDFTLGYLTWDAVNQTVWHAANHLPPAPTDLAAAPGNGQISLQWNATPTATSYNVYTSAGTDNAYVLNTSVVGAPDYTDAPLNNGTTYFYRVTAVNAYGEGPASAAANATPQAVLGNLPAPWQDADFVTVILSVFAGYTAAGGGRFYLYGAGADISGAGDAFNYMYQPLSGDGLIIARVKSQAATDGWARAGVMLRETPATNAIQVMAVLTPGNGVRMQYRALTGGGSTDLAGPAVAAPYWLKVSRRGSNLVAAASGDGVTYTNIGAVSLAMGTNACLGLAVCSHNTNVLNTSVFDNVTVVVPPQITIQPQSLTVNQGDAVELAAAATSSVPATCQWLFNGAPVSGAQTSTLELMNVQPANWGSYAAVFSNDAGSVTSSPALLSVRPWLSVSQSGILSWSGAYSLERATNVLGPYAVLPGAASPFTNADSSSPQQFFRLQH